MHSVRSALQMMSAKSLCCHFRRATWALSVGRLGSALAVEQRNFSSEESDYTLKKKAEDLFAATSEVGLRIHAAKVNDFPSPGVGKGSQMGRGKLRQCVCGGRKGRVE